MMVDWVLAAALMVSPVTQQQEQPQPTAPKPQAQTPAKEEPSDDVVVTGLRDLNDPGSLVTDRTLNSGRAGAGRFASQRFYDLSTRYATCVVDDKPGTLSLLRAIIDGNVNSARQRFAMNELAQRRLGCPSLAQFAPGAGVSLTLAPYDGSYYERGALMIEAIRQFAPTLSLSKAQTNDPEVQRRFNTREIARARFRLPVDFQYFEYAICFVREQPELAVKLTTTTGSLDAIDRLEAAIVNGGRLCVGNAKNVYFDARQFRFYIADAVYRWAVAAQGVDSLLPPVAKAD